MEQNQFVAGNNRTSETVSDPFVPDSLWAVGGPFVRYIGSLINTLPIRPKELRPITCSNCGGQEKTGDYKMSRLSHDVHHSTVRFIESKGTARPRREKVS